MIKISERWINVNIFKYWSEKWNFLAKIINVLAKNCMLNNSINLKVLWEKLALETQFQTSEVMSVQNWTKMHLRKNIKIKLNFKGLYFKNGCRYGPKIWDLPISLVDVHLWIFSDNSERVTWEIPEKLVDFIWNDPATYNPIWQAEVCCDIFCCIIDILNHNVL